MIGRVTAGFALALTTIAAAGCGSGSADRPAPVPTSSTSIDRAAVDAALGHVLTGLRAVSAPSSGPGQAVIVASARQAAAQLRAAAASLVPPPTGVPSAVASPVATRLTKVAGLMAQTASCLAALPAVTAGSATSCSQPLRDADSLTPQLAHDLISLAAYGSSSPSRFESDLVAVLRGQ
jgi:hypothetical protein